jgi:hypothetical protein
MKIIFILRVKEMAQCPYRYLFGKPGEGAHSYRFAGLAIVDTLLTFLGAWIITAASGINIKITFAAFFILGEILHYAFGTQTAFLTMIGVKVGCD